jgi:SAM-dependent methyltransferase
MPNEATIRAGYTHRPDPGYFADTEQTLGQTVWQPDVYAHVAEVAAALGATQLIDFGCGTGGKLARLAKRFEIVGIDYGPNIEWCRQSYHFGTWIEHDFDAPDVVGVDAARGIVICADVIEHVRHPDVLAAKLRAALDQGALAVLISTPEREVTWGLWHDGPPPNVAHVREWTVRELTAFLRRQGFHHGSAGLTRNNTVENVASTILCAYVADPTNLARLEDALIDADRPPVPSDRPLSKAARVRRGLARRIAVVR